MDLEDIFPLLLDENEKHASPKTTIPGESRLKAVVVPPEASEVA
jgi:hypothetical protein